MTLLVFQLAMSQSWDGPMIVPLTMLGHLIRCELCRQETFRRFRWPADWKSIGLTLHPSQGLQT